MRVGIYGRDGCPELAALSRGFAALGYRVDQRSGSDYRSGEIEPFDVVATSSIRGGFGLVASEYAARRVPTIVLDFGYLRRAGPQGEGDAGYYQAGVGGLNSIPPFACPQDRLSALELVLRRRERRGDYVLLAGQVPGDGAHGLDHAALEARYGRAVEALRREVELPILFRPHPRAPEVRCPTVDAVSSAERPLETDLAGAAVFATLTSTAGFAALLAGVPVVCDLGAPYAEAASATWAEFEDEDAEPGWLSVSWLEADLPDPREVEALLARVAYGQWKLAELASGEAVRFLVEWATTGAAHQFLFDRRVA